MATKRDALRNHVGALCGWLVDEKLCSAEFMTAMVKEHKLDEKEGLSKVAGYLEHFFLKPAQQGVMRAYVEQQVKEGQVVLLKLLNAQRPAHVPASELKFRHFTPEQIDRLTQYLENMLRVLFA
jgi:hypothetical protein